MKDTQNRASGHGSSKEGDDVTNPHTGELNYAIWSQCTEKGDHVIHKCVLSIPLGSIGQPAFSLFIHLQVPFLYYHMYLSLTYHPNHTTVLGPTGLTLTNLTIPFLIILLLACMCIYIISFLKFPLILVNSAILNYGKTTSFNKLLFKLLEYKRS